jgi:hypothetical protein
MELGSSSLTTMRESGKTWSVAALEQSSNLRNSGKFKKSTNNADQRGAAVEITHIG